MKKKWVGIVVTFQILFISNLFSQDSRVDTFFNTNNNSYELYFYKSDVLYKYLEFVNDSITRERIIENSNIFETKYHRNGRVKEKLQEQIILLDGDELYGRINNRLVFNSNGDTTTFEKYSSSVNIEQFKRDYFTYPQESISFFYNSSNVLIKRTRRTVQTKYPEDICSYGWQYEYFDDGTLKKKDYYESTTSKTILSFQLNYYGTPCTAFLSKSFLYYPNGKIANKTVFNAKKVECEKYDSTGRLISKHQSDFSFHYENYNDWQKSTYYYGNGEKIELGPNETIDFNNDRILKYQKFNSEGNLIEIKEFYPNGQLRLEQNKSKLKLYSPIGEYLLEVKLNLNNLNDPVNLYDVLPKIKTGTTINKKELKYYVLDHDTLVLFKGQLIETLNYVEDYSSGKIYKNHSFNYATNMGFTHFNYYNSGQYQIYHLINEEFKEYWNYQDNNLHEKRTLIEIVDGKLIYETTSFDDNTDRVTRYDFRDYSKNLFYYIGNVFNGGRDSVILKDNYIPTYSEDWYFNGGNSDRRNYPIKEFKYNKDLELLSYMETFSRAEDASENIYKIVNQYFIKGIKYQEEIKYKDSLITKYYTLDSENIHIEKSMNINGQWKYYNEKANIDTNNNLKNIQLNFPYSNLDPFYFKKSYDNNKRYELYSKSFVFDHLKKAVLYSNSNNIPDYENDLLTLLIPLNNQLYFLYKNSVYDFEEDSYFIVDSIGYFLGYNQEFIWYANRSGKLMKAKLADLLLNKNISNSFYDNYTFLSTSEYNYTYRYLPDINNLLRFCSENIIVFPYPSDSIDILHLNNNYSTKIKLNKEGTFNYHQIENWLILFEPDFNFENIQYINLFNDKLSSINLSILPKKNDSYKARKIKHKDKLVLAKQIDHNEYIFKNDSMFIFTYTYDWYDDFTDCCGTRFNYRNLKQFFIDFKNNKVTPIKKITALPIELINNYEELTEAFYKSEFHNTYFTQQITNTFNFNSKILLQTKNKEIKINLFDGSYLISDTITNSNNESGLSNSKFDLSNISLIDKDAIKRFVLKGYRINKKQIYHEENISSISDGLYSYHDPINNKHLIQPEYLNYLRIHWNGNKERVKERIVAISLINYQPIFYTPDHYYFSPGRAHQSLSYQVGLTVYPFEQFDLKYNRPDIILDRLGYADSSLVLAYHQAYLKRLKKMGFTEEMLKDDIHLPELKIKNFENIPLITDSTSINLNIDIEDTKYKLDRINIWINDVPIYGSNGVSIRERNTQKDNVHLKIPLAIGKNKVQLSVLNQAGAESYKETFNIECKTGKKQPDLYLITIGGSSFKQNEFNLTYAAKDASDLASLLSKSPVYKKVFKKVIINDSVTRENILQLKSLLKNADINDHVVVFLADHGVLNANLDYYLATYDMDFENPEINGIAYDELESLLDGIKPLKKTLILDACHSGEIDQEEVELANNIEKSNGYVQFRAIGKKVNAKLGSTNTLELAKSLFTDLRKGTGATVISSAGGMEFAMESDKWKNGLFTYCLLNGITSKDADLNKDGEIWLSELQKHIQQQVKLLSNGAQQPTSRIENQLVDFRLW